MDAQHACESWHGGVCDSPMVCACVPALGGGGGRGPEARWPDSQIF